MPRRSSLPSSRNWRPGQKTLIDGALGAAGTNADAVGMGKLAQNGVLYKGLEALGGGAIITGLIFGGIVVMLIDRKTEPGLGIFCLIGAILAYFGFIHGPRGRAGGIADDCPQLRADGDYLLWVFKNGARHRKNPKPQLDL